MSLRLRRSTQPATDRWRTLPVTPRVGTKLGFNFRLPQAEAFALDPHAALERLHGMGFQVVRLAALWNRVEPAPRVFDPTSVDWQVEAAVRHGVEVVLSLGPVKNFGYPEFYVPRHHLPEPLPEGRLITPGTHPRLAEAALTVLQRLAERYRGVSAISAWQVEHEAVDPLGLEHSWRLGAQFVARELDLVRSLDPSRPVVLNGYLPMSGPVSFLQRWRTRDQGDSLAFAAANAGIVGLDIYPCHGLAAVGSLSLYLDARHAAARRHVGAALQEAGRHGRPVMVTEGQAEPWEAVTEPPSPMSGLATVSCPPDRLIETYNVCLDAAATVGVQPEAYVFWGTEYWLRRERDGDSTYLESAERVISNADG